MTDGRRQFRGLVEDNENRGGGFVAWRLRQIYQKAILKKANLKERS
jgi:hypothetical protein